MRVVTVVKTSTGGTWLVPLMSALRNRGHQVTVLVPQPSGPLGSRLRRCGVEVASAPAPAPGRSPLSQLRGIWQLRAQLRRLQPDVLHYHLYASAVVARLASLGLPIRRAHMVPGPLFLENALIWNIERVLARADDLVICTSEHLRTLYRRLGVPEGRLAFIPYGVDCHRFSPVTDAERTAARSEIGVPADAFVAVCTAFFYAPKALVHRGRGIKGHDTLLQSWSAFHRSGGRGRLLLVGGGFGPAGERYRAELRAWACHLPGADTVTWIDSVDDVRRFYAAADVSVSPSLSENYGAVAEAAACGVPSIATTVGGLPELVDDRTGFSYPPSDSTALTARLHQAHRAHQIGELRRRGAAARQRAVALLELSSLLSAYCSRMEALVAA